MKNITISKYLTRMKRKRFLLLVVISLFCFSSVALAVHPAQDIMYLYAGKLPYLDFFEPYTVGILALNELEYGQNIAKVRTFIQWYFENLNYPDRYNIKGTIYDYTIKKGWAIPTYKYDSIDGYSGIFLHLLLKYVKITGDMAIVESNWSKIEDIAYTIPLLQEGDGLTIALIDTNQKYLTDNCEAYGGISAYLELRKMMELYESPSYEKVRENIKKGIMKRMYQKKNKIFSHVIEDDEIHNSSWNRYYPDAYGQFFLIYYDLISDNPKMIQYIWGNFEKRYAAKADQFPIEQRIMYQLTKNKMQREYADLL